MTTQRELDLTTELANLRTLLTLRTRVVDRLSQLATRQQQRIRQLETRIRELEEHQ